MPLDMLPEPAQKEKAKTKRFDVVQFHPDPNKDAVSYQPKALAVGLQRPAHYLTNAKSGAGRAVNASQQFLTS